MTDYAPPEELDIPPGEYQAEVSAVIQGAGIGVPPETIVLFRLTEPGKGSGHPQAGLGGRIARAWFALDDENPRTRDAAKARLDALKIAAGAQKIDDAIGSIVRIRVARVVMRSDPSRYKSAVVHVIPPRPSAPEFVS